VGHGEEHNGTLMLSSGTSIFPWCDWRCSCGNWCSYRHCFYFRLLL
jgi:hypothetical protein